MESPRSPKKKKNKKKKKGELEVKKEKETLLNFVQILKITILRHLCLTFSKYSEKIPKGFNIFLVELYNIS